jgi:mono/diheme cytochrome c family protein
MSRQSLGMAFGTAVAAALWGGVVSGRPVAAQDRENPSAAAPAPAAPSTQTVIDPYQRSYEIYNYQTTAKSGPQRGEELYFFKCWVCHNQYVQAGSQTGPQLKGLFKRTPVTDADVADKIKSGGLNMPAYRTTLKDADIADLVAYLKSDKCCFDAENPPPNPRYRYR